MRSVLQNRPAKDVGLRRTTRRRSSVNEWNNSFVRYDNARERRKASLAGSTARRAVLQPAGRKRPLAAAIT